MGEGGPVGPERGGEGFNLLVGGNGEVEAGREGNRDEERGALCTEYRRRRRHTAWSHSLRSFICHLAT